MNQQTTIIIIISVAVLVVLLLFIKNMRDGKKMITPEDGTDPVSELHTAKKNQADKM